MKNIEQYIYNLVKKNVVLKTFLRKVYQSVFLLTFPKKIDTKYKINVVEGYFFGFHDKTPWCSNNKKILAHKYPNIKGLPKKNDFVEIGFFKDNELKEFVSLDKTQSWNWQQASMLQWLGNSDKLIFNFWNGKENQSKIINTKGEEVSVMPKPINAVSYDGKYAVCFDFDRLNIGMNGYGYANSSKEILEKDSDIPKEMGFYIYEIKTGNQVAFKSVYEINEALENQKLQNAYIFVTHFIFSPDSKRLLFLLRAFNRGKRLISRLITCDFEGNNLYLLPTGDMVSHLSWVGNDKILAYCSDKNNIDAYYLFQDLTKNYSCIGKELFSVDGHPQYNETAKSFITDTYPNRKRIQELAVFNFHTNKKTLIGKFFSPMKFSEAYRCDLHPRWDRNGKKICVDTTYTGKRSLAVINLK